MKIGSPVLRVKNIDKILAFYVKGLGLHVNKTHQNHGDNGNLIYEIGFKHIYSDKPVVILHHDPSAKTASRHSAGLYHFAILVPDRKSLASTYLALRDSGISYEGFADHLVSESLYLRDPENNGIEIYWDRPTREWLRDSEGHIMMDTLPLNLDSLAAEMNNNDDEQIKNAEAFPTEAKIGHIHLKVTNLKRSVKFYHEKVGLDITANWRSMGAAFLSAGGYHHHIGLNTWNSLHGDLHTHGEAGLENFTITIPDKSFVNSIKSIIIADDEYTSAVQNQKKQNPDKDQFLVSDPDGIDIFIKSE